MAQPIPYDRTYDFTSYQESFPASPLPAAPIDTEFDNVGISIGEIIDRLALIQRDDGGLHNSIVTLDSLGADVTAALGSPILPRGNWITATAYAVLDMVTKSGITYICSTAHTSGTFNTDLAAFKWIAFTSTINLANIAQEILGISYLGLYDDGDTSGYQLTIQVISALTANRALTVNVDNGSRDLDILDDAIISQDYSATGRPTFANVDITGKGYVKPYLGMPADGRLTLTSGTPVTTGDVTAASTLYYVPYVGNRIALYTAGAWEALEFTQRSIALSGLTAGKPYDVFIYNNAGTPTLELLVWTNDTTRATALAYQDGVLCKSGALDRRYLGTIYTSGTTTTEDTLAKRWVWNYYNRVNRRMEKLASTASWTYTTSVIRQANADVANQLDYVVGVAEDTVYAELNCRVANSSANIAFQIGIGVDVTNALGAAQSWGTTGAATNYALARCAIHSMPTSPGRHFLAWCEWSSASGTMTWEGQSTFGLQGMVRG